MARGGGKYDAECQTVMLTTGANTVVIIVVGGDRGTGFSVVSKDPEVESKLPIALRDMADQIEVKTEQN